MTEGTKPAGSPVDVRRGTAVGGDHTSGRDAASPEVARLALVVALPLVFVVSCGVTYHAAADGPRGAYLRLLLVEAGVSVTAYGLMRLRASFDSCWPLAVLVVWLAVPATLHVARVLHPLGRGAPFVEVYDTFASGRLDPTRWEATVAPEAQLSLEPGAAKLTAAAGAGASLELLAPPARWWLRPPARWWLPLTFDQRRFAERLEWQARVERRGTFFIMLETQHLLVQLTASGLHLTYRDTEGGVSSAEVSLPGLHEPQDHRWSLERGMGRLSLFLDGRDVWMRDVAEPLGRIRFGETRSDEMHGGTIVLRSVHYRRWWDVAAR